MASNTNDQPPTPPRCPSQHPPDMLCFELDRAMAMTKDYEAQIAVETAANHQKKALVAELDLEIDELTKTLTQAQLAGATAARSDVAMPSLLEEMTAAHRSSCLKAAHLEEEIGQLETHVATQDKEIEDLEATLREKKRLVERSKADYMANVQLLRDAMAAATHLQ